jgi:hypothetical protein
MGICQAGRLGSEAILSVSERGTCDSGLGGIYTCVKSMVKPVCLHCQETKRVERNVRGASRADTTAQEC